jgi:Short C-terminal domain
MTAVQQIQLPGGAELAAGETPMVGDRFMYSTIAFYLHTELVLTDRRLYSLRPNVLFGLIPVGTERSNFPIESIAGITAGTRFDLLGVIVGVFGVLFGIGFMAVPGVSILGLLLALFGLALIVGAPKQTIDVMNSGGGQISFRVSVFDRARTVEFANRVSQALARTSSRASAGALPAAGPSAPSGTSADALRNLQALRDQGLITDAEFATKRAEILARL